MTHRDVIPLLSELLSNRVPEPGASEAWAHVATCAECRQAVTAMHEVRAAVARAGSEVFDAHPISQEIVLFALSDPGLSEEVRAKIETHAAGCVSCGNEILLTRRAEAASRRTGSGPISIPGGGVAWLAPALAAVVVVLAYPAFLGLAHHPSLVRAHQESGRQIDELRDERSRLSNELSAERLLNRGGPVRVLYLPAITRGEDRHPRMTLLPGQAWQPVIIQHRPFAGSTPTGVARLTVIREADGTSIWSEAVKLADAWDPELGALALLIPARDLEAGNYRLTLGGPAIVPSEWAFRVLASP